MAAVTASATLDERALVEQAQTGNRLAFEELVRRYDRDVLRLARPDVHDVDGDVEEDEHGHRREQRGHADLEALQEGGRESLTPGAHPAEIIGRFGHGHPADGGGS